MDEPAASDNFYKEARTLRRPDVKVDFTCSGVLIVELQKGFSVQRASNGELWRVSHSSG